MNKAKLVYKDAKFASVSYQLELLHASSHIHLNDFCTEHHAPHYIPSV
jgi:hypothetical protein